MLRAGPGVPANGGVWQIYSVRRGWVAIQGGTSNLPVVHSMHRTNVVPGVILSSMFSGFSDRNRTVFFRQDVDVF